MEFQVTPNGESFAGFPKSVILKLVKLPYFPLKDETNYEIYRRQKENVYNVER